MTPWTPEQRSEALELYIEHGPAAASEATGIPSGTIRAWAHRDPAITVARHEKTRAATEAAKLHRECLREELRTELLAKAVDLLDRMDHEHVEFVGKDARRETFDRAPAGACKAYATAAAILLDKFRLEMGDATERHEHFTTDRDAAEERVAKLVDLNARRAS